MSAKTKQYHIVSKCIIASDALRFIDVLKAEFLLYSGAGMRVSETNLVSFHPVW